MFHQVALEANFGCEQKKDDHLKRCCGQVQQIEEIKQNPEQPLPAAYFLVKGDLLYFRTDRRG